MNTLPKQYSLFSLLLCASSAIVGWTYSSKKTNDKQIECNGRLVASTNAAEQTCITEVIVTDRNCYNTESVGAGASSASTVFLAESSCTDTPGNTTVEDCS